MPFLALFGCFEPNWWRKRAHWWRAGGDAGIISNTAEILVGGDVADVVVAVVSRPEELHLRPLVELCVRLSPQTAPISRSRMPAGHRAAARSVLDGREHDGILDADGPTSTFLSGEW